jgi:Ca2+-binding EF-hand superfamily protein
MTFPKLAFALTTALALAAGGAFAADKAKKNSDPGFNALDKNNDGYLSRAEAAGNPDLAKKWKEADRNNDGKLSRGEYLIVMGKKDATTAKNKVSNAISKNKEKDNSAATGSSQPSKP